MLAEPDLGIAAGSFGAREPHFHVKPDRIGNRGDALLLGIDAGLETSALAACPGDGRRNRIGIAHA